MAFQEQCFSGNIFYLMFFHTCILNNDNAHKLLFTSSQNSTFFSIWMGRSYRIYPQPKFSSSPPHKPLRSSFLTCSICCTWEWGTAYRDSIHGVAVHRSMVEQWLCPGDNGWRVCHFLDRYVIRRTRFYERMLNCTMIYHTNARREGGARKGNINVPRNIHVMCKQRSGHV